jgi:hypothetical protein
MNALKEWTCLKMFHFIFQPLTSQLYDFYQILYPIWFNWLNQLIDTQENSDWATF